MPRPHLIRTSEFPYHVSCRTNNKEWFYVNLDQCWNIFSKHLNIVSEKYQAKIISFVLMSNHFHMLLHTPLCNIDLVMNHLLREVSKQMGLQSNRINHIFGARYSRCLIQSDIYFYHAYKYVYRNPPEAKITLKVEDYPYSTLQHVINKSSLQFPCHDLEIFPCDLIPTDIKKRQLWLNEPYPNKENRIIRNTLRRSIFELPTGKNVAKSVKNLLTLPKR